MEYSLHYQLTAKISLELNPIHIITNIFFIFTFKKHRILNIIDGNTGKTEASRGIKLINLYEFYVRSLAAGMQKNIA